MPENMSISVNGQSQVPPGFRFHPTEEELLQYYLRKKVSYEKIDLDVIRDVDLNKLEPWDIQEKCKIGSTPQNDWYFFSHKDKKYPTGTRTNRATTAGFWKATGRDKVIYSCSRRIGMRKTLVFYKGRAPHGQKSDWIMHEYRLDDNTLDSTSNINVSNAMGDVSQEEGWVVCRIFKKKNLHKTQDSLISNSSLPGETRAQRLSSSDEGTLEQIFQYMGRGCEDEADQEANNGKAFVGDSPLSMNKSLHERFMKLPSLESSSSGSRQPCYPQMHVQMLTETASPGDHNSVYSSETGLNNWAALDRFAASRLNGQTESSSKPELGGFSDPTTVAALCSPSDHDLQLHQLLLSASGSRAYHSSQDYSSNNEFGLWSFGRSSLSPADPMCHLPNAPV